MPLTALKHLAKKAGKSVADAEHAWEHAKKIVKSEYKKSEDDASFWALTTGITKKMLGLSESITFRQFIDEGAVDKQPTYTSLEVEKAIKILNDHCKDALWMLKEGRPLFRGDKNILPSELNKTGFLHVDPSKTERRSQNTSNFYTLILDNHPDRQDFPKRSRSFICTQDDNYARGYASEDTGILRVIPYDGVKIGFVNDEDMWNTRVSIFDSELYTIESINSKFKKLQEYSGIINDTDWNTWIKFDKLLKDGDDNCKQAFIKSFGYYAYKNYKNSFLKEVLRAYSADWTGHEVHTTKTMPHAADSEVWVGGDCIIINDRMWKALKAGLDEK